MKNLLLCLLENSDLDGEIIMNNNTISIGNAGEYFIAGELEKRGYTVAVPMSNT